MIGRNVLMVLVFGLGLAAVAGCQQGVAREDFDALKKHNEKLMNENAQIRTDWEQMKADSELPKATPPLAAIEPTPARSTPADDLNRIKAQLPAGTQLVERGGNPVIRIDGAMVNYGSGKAALSPEGQQAMDRVAIILNRDFAGRAVVVEGHTDADPINRTKNLYKNNWELGMKRSTEVVDYLMLKGVDPKRIRATSFGEQQPISQDKAKNRRVEIVVMQNDAYATPSPTAAIQY